MKKSFIELKEKQRKKRADWITSNAKITGLKVHRALSWLKASEESNNTDMSFISLWISFNSLYGYENNNIKEYTPERLSFKKFFKNIIMYDYEQEISSKLWKHYSHLFRLFIDNKYVFSPFWSYQKGLISETEWKKQFEYNIHLSKLTLGHHDTATFLGLIFDRLYVLRNQIMHGGSTFDSSINREQLQLGYRVLAELLPTLIDILIENPEVYWGEPTYQPIK